MALSNIFREPQREITETTVGAGVMLATLGPLGVYAWFAANHIHAHDPNSPWLLQFVFVLVTLSIGIAIGVGLLVGVAVAVHRVGERVCDRLQDAGVHLRPRQRR